MATIVDQNRLSEVKLSHREYFLQFFSDLLYGGAASPAEPVLLYILELKMSILEP